MQIYNIIETALVKIVKFIIFPSFGGIYLKIVVYLQYDVTGSLTSQKETSNKMTKNKVAALD